MLHSPKSTAIWSMIRGSHVRRAFAPKPWKRPMIDKPDLMSTVLSGATLPDPTVSRSASKTAQLSLFDCLTYRIAGVDKPLACTPPIWAQ